METVLEMGAQHTKTANPNEASVAVCTRPALLLPELISIKDCTEDWWTMKIHI
ncbi:MAG TPA: hypothetical protein VN277_09055 [Acidiferrobacterales bacterium]|nr:hypothetical protein [Acidiferrobacterales bacterium]